MRIDATPWARQALDKDARAQLRQRLPPLAKLYLTARGPNGPYAATLTHPWREGRHATGPTLQTAIDRVLS